MCSVTDPNHPSLAVVIPAHDEAAGIEACARAVCSALDQLPNRSALIVVDDGSRDGTGAILDTLSRELSGLVTLRHAENRGYGAGLRTGVVEARKQGFDYVLFMDSDLTNDPAYIAAFAHHMQQGVDVIKGSRYVRGGGMQGVPAWRSSLSRIGNLVARLLFGLPIRDCTNGFRAIRAELLAGVELRENGFAVIMEELYRLIPYASTYAEVPIVLTARGTNLRPSSFAFGPRAMARYLKYPLLSRWHRLAKTVGVHDPTAAWPR